MSIDEDTHTCSVPFSTLSSDEGYTTPGTITVNALPAGTWHGICNWNINSSTITYDGYTITWSAPLAYTDKFVQEGVLYNESTSKGKPTGSNFINNDSLIPIVDDFYTITYHGTSDIMSKAVGWHNDNYAPETSMEGYKQIIYQHPDDTWRTANPYQTGHILIKKGSNVYFQMYAGAEGHNSGIDGSGIYVEELNDNDNVGVWTGMNYGNLNLICIGMPLTNGTLSCDEDDINTNGSWYNTYVFNWALIFTRSE